MVTTLKNKGKPICEEQHYRCLLKLSSFCLNRYFFKLVQKYQTDKAAKGINTWDQLIAMMFCQLSGAESLREISDGLYSSIGRLNHLGAHAVGRSCLSYVNQHRDYHVYQDFYYGLLDHYREVLTGARVNQILTGKKIFSLDSTMIGLCLKLFDWARFRSTKGGIKLHTLLDNDTLMPSFIAVRSQTLKPLEHWLTFHRTVCWPLTVVIMTSGGIDSSVNATLSS